MMAEFEDQQSPEIDSEILKPRSPVRGESATSAPLNNTRALLPPEMQASRYRALGNLARQRNITPPDIGVN